MVLTLCYIRISSIKILPAVSLLPVALSKVMIPCAIESCSSGLLTPPPSRPPPPPLTRVLTHSHTHTHTHTLTHRHTHTLTHTHTGPLSVFRAPFYNASLSAPHPRFLHFSCFLASFPSAIRHSCRTSRFQCKLHLFYIKVNAFLFECYD